jgi:hypothetical protein
MYTPRGHPSAPSATPEGEREGRGRISSGRPWLAVIARAALGGVIAAIIDIGSACLISHRSAIFILHVIAGGVLAERSFAGGAETAFLGAALQVAMGILIAVIFALIGIVFPILRRRWVACGLAYGVVIFAVMNYVVMPLSAWRRVPIFSIGRVFANLVAMLLFGLVVAFFARNTLNSSPELSKTPGLSAHASRSVSRSGRVPEQNRRSGI